VTILDESYTGPQIVNEGFKISIAPCLTGSFGVAEVSDYWSASCPQCRHIDGGVFTRGAAMQVLKDIIVHTERHAAQGDYE
jgi:hypothetical protein